jgi:hypothetical protein
MIKQFIIILFLIFGLGGCTLLPRITFDKSGVTPTATVKSQKKESCSGTYTVDKNGNIISCSKNYNNYENNYSKKERVLTLQEKISNFFRGLAGWGFWGLVIIIILCPSLLGLIVGRVFNATNIAFSQTVAAIKAFRQKVSVEEKERLDAFLRDKQDAKTKQLVAAERTKV